MTDETTKELEDLSTLACSTDEVVRKRALVAMLVRVVGRATHVDELPAEEAARVGVLEASLREVTQQRDHARQQVREFDALLSRIWEAVPANIATPNSGLGIAEAVHALVERLMSDRFTSDTAMRELAKERDTHKANAEHAEQEAAANRTMIGSLWARIPFRLAEEFRREDLLGAVEALVSENSAHANNSETLARDLAEAREELEKTLGERDTARALRSVKDALSLETVLQCLGGVLNDMTRGGDFEKAEARSFHDSACIRLRSLAGSPETAGRVLTKQEESTLIVGLVGATTYGKALRWLERKGYLSVRLPPEE